MSVFLCTLTIIIIAYIRVHHFQGIWFAVGHVNSKNELTISIQVQEALIYCTHVH